MGTPETWTPAPAQQPLPPVSPRASGTTSLCLSFLIRKMWGITLLNHPELRARGRYTWAPLSPVTAGEGKHVNRVPLC